MVAVPVADSIEIGEENCTLEDVASQDELDHCYFYMDTDSSEAIDERPDVAVHDSSSLVRGNSLLPGACDLEAVDDRQASMSDEKMRLEEKISNR